MALEKLQIQAFSDAACTSKVSGPIKAFINPESYSRDCTITYKDAKVIGNPKATKVFVGMGQDTLSLNNLIVDGTGIVSLGNYQNVDAYIKAFTDTVYRFNGSMHQANFLMITWGSLNYIGVCKSFKVRYTMFKPDGSALRAFIDLTVESSIDLKTKSKMAGLQSPDLTHFRTVKAGDTLPLMTFRIYGDSAYYLQVAQINNLKNIFALRPGDKIYFPPLKK
jgi:hypothetical protein